MSIDSSDKNIIINPNSISNLAYTILLESAQNELVELIIICAGIARVIIADFQIKGHESEQDIYDSLEAIFSIATNIAFTLTENNKAILEMLYNELTNIKNFSFFWLRKPIEMLIDLLLFFAKNYHDIIPIKTDYYTDSNENNLKGENLIRFSLSMLFLIFSLTQTCIFNKKNDQINLVKKLFSSLDNLLNSGIRNRLSYGADRIDGAFDFSLWTARLSDVPEIYNTALEYFIATITGIIDSFLEFTPSKVIFFYS